MHSSPMLKTLVIFIDFAILKTKTTVMTVQDIEEVQVIIKSKDGRFFVAKIDDIMVVDTIVESTEFIQLDEDKVARVHLKDCAKRK